MRAHSLAVSCAILAGAAVIAATAEPAAKPEPPSPPYFEVQATLRDGKEVSCYAPAKTISFSAVAPDGKTVKVDLPPQPDWSNARTVCTIDLDEGGKVYVVRHFAWTGELKSLWDTLTVGQEGQELTINGKQVRSFRLDYVKPPKPKGS